MEWKGIKMRSKHPRIPTRSTGEDTSLALLARETENLSSSKTIGTKDQNFIACQDVLLNPDFSQDSYNTLEDSKRKQKYYYAKNTVKNEYKPLHDGDCQNQALTKFGKRGCVYRRMARDRIIWGKMDTLYAETAKT